MEPETRIQYLATPALEPADPPVRLGILGAARITRRLAPAIRAARGAKLAGVASRDPSRARDKAAEWDCRPFESYEELLASPDVDGVYIPLPNGLHAEWIERALESGKMVLCEKSLVATPEQLERVRGAVARTGGWVEETFQYRYSPLVDWAVEACADNRFGRIRRGVVHFSFVMDDPTNVRWDFELGGGAALDVGCYGVSLLRLLLGEEPQRVRGEADWRDSPTGPVDASLAIYMNFPSGTEGIVRASFVRHRAISWALIGSDASLHCLHDFAWHPAPGSDHVELHVADVAGRMGRKSVSAGSIATPPEELGPEVSDLVVRAPVRDPYEAMVEDSCARWRRGDPPRWGARDAEGTLKVLWTALASARSDQSWRENGNYA